MPSDNLRLILGLVIIIPLVSYGLYQCSELKKKGRITIAKAIRYEGKAHGSSLYIEIYFNGKIVHDIVNALCPECVGKYYYVKVKPDNPSSFAILFENQQVPECILSKPLPLNGWKEIPECK